MSRREYFGNRRIKRLRVSFVEVVNKKEQDVLTYIFETEGSRRFRKLFGKVRASGV